MGNSTFYVSNRYDIPVLLQDKQMNCWVYAAAMLKSWQLKSRLLNGYKVFEYYLQQTTDHKNYFTAEYFKAYANDTNPATGGLRFYFPSVTVKDADGIGSITFPAHVNLIDLKMFFKGLGFKPLNIFNALDFGPEKWNNLLKEKGPMIFFRVKPNAHVRLFIGTYTWADFMGPTEAIILDPASGQEERLSSGSFLSDVSDAAEFFNWQYNIWYAETN